MCARRNKKVNRIVKLTSLASVSLLSSFSNGFVGESASKNDVSYVRNVSYSESENLDFDDFETSVYQETSYGFQIVATKNFDSSLFKKVDLVSSSSDDIEVTYEVHYFESEGRVTLDLYQNGNPIQDPLLETVEGLVTLNPDGEADVLFASGNEYIYLSELLQESPFDQASWWKKFCEWVKGKVQKVIDVVVSGLRLLTHIAVEVIGRDGAVSFLDMTKDSNGIYHADFDCWQQIGGYTDFYDFVFRLGSKMRTTKTIFYDDDDDGQDDYVIWGWKGDYWELGYGGEMGIYKRLGDSEVWYVDKKLSIDMTLMVEYRTSTENTDWTTIIDWDPSEAEGYSDKTWWITGFNPEYAGQVLQNPELLRATYTIHFETAGYDEKLNNELRDGFLKKKIEDSNDWKYDETIDTFSYIL